MDQFQGAVTVASTVAKPLDKARPVRTAVGCPSSAQTATDGLGRLAHSYGSDGPSAADRKGRAQGSAAGCPHLDALAGHIRDFAEMMTRRQGLLALEDWLTRVEADDQPELHSLAAGIRRDQEAVTAGLALPTTPAPWRAMSTRSLR